MTGKTCLITGATSGIGAAAALDLARLGAFVIVHGRNSATCAATVNAIRRQGGARVESVVADLASLEQVRRLAGEVEARFPSLDVLVNNAGSYFFERTLTADGLERTFAVNYLSHFLLTNLLLERLKASPAGRIVCVSSEAHADGQIDFENLQGERRYDRLDAYARSKLALLMFTYELSRRLSGTRILVNACHPGVVATNLGSENGWLRGWARVKLRNAVNRSMLPPAVGAQVVVKLASAPDLLATGRYFDQGREARSSSASYDEVVARKLWSVSEVLTSADAR